MSRLNAFTKIIVSLLLIGLAAGAIIFSFAGKIETKAKQISEKRNMLAILAKQDDNFLLLKSNYQVVRRELPAVKNMLPDENGLDGVVNALEALATRTGNDQVLTFEPLGNAASAGSLKSVGFSSVLAGNIGSFAAYLAELEKLPYFIEVDNVAIANSAGIADNNGQLNLKAKIYIRSK